MELWQNGSMARGWESKDVESQVETLEVKKAQSHPQERTAEQLSRQNELQGLQLSRTKILHDLESATHPRHREQLEAALKFLDDKIAALQ